MTLKEVLQPIKDLLSSGGVLGTLQPGNLPAIAVEPGPQQGTSVSGLLVVVNRVPLGTSEPLTGGVVYHPDEYVLRLINYATDSKLATALRLLEVEFITSRKIYMPPTSTAREQARIHLFIPSTSNK